MSSEERRLRTDTGLLSWDGRVLELFPTDGKNDRWRLHAATVLKWEWEQRKGCGLVKVFDHSKHYEAVLVADGDRPWIDATMAAVVAFT